MEIRIVEETVTEVELRDIAKVFYGHMVKGVVDIDKEIAAFGGEYHMDANNMLIRAGSEQPNIWGFNWYFDVPDEERIEYTSLINIRPHQGNKTMEIIDMGLRKRIHGIITKKIIL